MADLGAEVLKVESQTGDDTCQWGLRRVIAEADVVIENFKDGGLAKFGLDNKTLQKENPGLVYCSVTGVGQDGPYADRAG